VTALLIRNAYVRLIAACLGTMVPLFLAHSGMQAAEFSTYRAIEFLPYVVLGILTGAAVDAFGPRLLGNWATYAHLAPPLLFLGTVTNVLPLQTLYVCLVLVVAAGYVASIAIAKAAAQTLDDAVLPKFNARITLIDKCAALSMPVVITWTASVSVVAAALIVCVCAVVTIPIVHAGERLPVSKPSSGRKWFAVVFERMVLGARALASNPPLYKLCMLVAAINAVEAVPGSFVVLYATKELELGYAQIGFIVTAVGAGGIVGALMAERLPSSRRMLWCVLGASAFFNALLYFVVFLWPSFECLLVTCFLEAGSFVFSAVAFRTLRQVLAQKEAFGVVLGVSGTLIKLGIPVSILAAGYIAERQGMATLYLMAGVAELCLVITFVAYLLIRSGSK
jgi:hypothetical protein